MNLRRRAATSAAIAMVALALGLGWLAWGPRPVERRRVTLDLPQNPSGARALTWEAPGWIVLGGASPIGLRVEMSSEAIRGGDILLARLAGPGFRVEPAGDQMAPARGTVGYQWTVTAAEAGEMWLRPEVSLRSEAQAVDRLIWSKDSAINVISLGGLRADELGTLSVGLALTGLAVGLSLGRGS